MKLCAVTTELCAVTTELCAVTTVLPLSDQDKTVGQKFDKTGGSGCLKEI